MKSRAIKNDVLITHGAKDKIVNVSYSKKAFDVYRTNNLGRNIRLEIIKNGGHGFSKKIDKTAIKILRDFVAS